MCTTYGSTPLTCSGGGDAVPCSAHQRASDNGADGMQPCGHGNMPAQAQRAAMGQQLGRNSTAAAAAAAQQQHNSSRAAAIKQHKQQGAPHASAARRACEHSWRCCRREHSRGRGAQRTWAHVGCESGCHPHACPCHPSTWPTACLGLSQTRAALQGAKLCYSRPPSHPPPAVRPSQLRPPGRQYAHPQFVVPNGRDACLLSRGRRGVRRAQRRAYSHELVRARLFVAGALRVRREREGVFIRFCWVGVWGCAVSEREKGRFEAGAGSRDAEAVGQRGMRTLAPPPPCVPWRRIWRKRGPTPAWQHCFV